MSGRALFWLACALAVTLAGLILLAPALASNEVPADGWPRVLGLLAHDRAVRRVGLFAAAGLFVSACIFFRPGPPEESSKE